jgi:hypothetical protein
MTDVGTASKKGARDKVVEDLRRQILLAFWVVEELPTTFSKPGHALPFAGEKSKGVSVRAACSTYFPASCTSCFISS